MKWIRFFFSSLNSHKLKLFVMILAIFVCSFFLFPFNDLGDFFSIQIAKLTKNAVYLQFENLRLSLFPSTGVAITDVHVETPKLPPISANEIILSPSIGSLIMKKPAGSLFIKGILKGDVEVSLKPGAKSDEKKIERQNITIKVKKISLEDLRNLARLPLAIKGSLSLDSEALIDFGFIEQPDAEIHLKIQDFLLPPSNIPTPIGPLSISGFGLGAIDLKGRLSAGRLEIQDGIIGKDGDEIKGTLKGGMALPIHNQGTMITPTMGSYSFDIQLTIKKSLQQREALLFQFLEQFKTPSGTDADQFKLRVSGQNTYGPPNISALR